MENQNQEFDLAKWLAGEMTGEELLAFERSPGFDTYSKISRYASRLKPPAFNEREMLSRVIASKPAVKVIPLYRNAFRIAAALVIALGIVFAASTFSASKEVAANGQLASFSLPDNSKVILNAGSEITYKKYNWNSHRNLDLSGEAYFQVAKGKKFEVATSLGTVTVLGTHFNVRAREGRFDVSCYEGRVKVRYRDSEVIITKGQSVAFADGNSIDVPANNAVGPEWLNSKLVFNKESLSRMVEELGRQYNVKIVLAGTPSGQLFTGILPMRNLDEALQILASAYHLNPIRSNGEIILQPIDG